MRKFLKSKFLHSAFASLAVIAMGLALVPASAGASSHREAPFISTDPAADNTTAEGRAQNRRVAVNILVSKAVDGIQLGLNNQ